MADLSRADELVQAMDRDAAFRAAVEAAPTAAAKRQLLDARGFGDVGLADMRAYVESKGGTLVVQPGGRELSEQELAAVAGGATEDEVVALSVVFGVVGGAALIGAAATAAV